MPPTVATTLGGAMDMVAISKLTGCATGGTTTSGAMTINRAIALYPPISLNATTALIAIVEPG